MYRILAHDQKEYGPVTAEEIRQWIAENRLNGDSLIQAEGASEWKPLSTFPEFADALKQRPTAPSAPYVPAAPAVPTLPASSSGTNGLSIASLVSGIVSLPGALCCCVGPITALLAIVFGFIALSQLKKNPQQGGKGLAITGIVLGAISLILFVLLMILGMAGQFLNPVGGGFRF